MEFESEGDPRFHFLINLVLSAGFVYVFMTGLELVSSFEFTLLRFVLGTVILVALTNTLI